MCLREARSTDIFARFGGEEFVLVMPDTDIDGARVILQRLLDGASRLSMWGACGEFNCQVSAGVAALREGGTLDSLLQRADRALYMAKDKGRNRVEVAD
jgi:diguanylate cyclase (GGDEF)-like protein